MSTALPLVSVCIPVYNRADLVQATVASVLAQDYPQLEIALQDDASDDGTAELLAHLAAEHPQVSVARNPVRLGVAGNTNAVLARARGELIAMMGSDDLLEPGFLHTCVQALQQSGADVVTTGYFWLRGAEKSERIPKVRGGLYRGALRTVLLENPFNVNVSLFRRPLLERLRRRGRFVREPLVSWDFELWLRVAASGATIHYLSDFQGGCYRLHTGNVSKGGRVMYRHTLLAILANRAALLAQCPLAYRYKLSRVIWHDWRDQVRGRPVDRRVHRAAWLAMLARARPHRV